MRLTGTDPVTVGAAWQRAAALLGDVVAAADDETPAARVLGLLAARSTDLAVAESLTGGLLAATLVDVPGASTVFRGGVVAYATPAKHALLRVDADLLARVGPVDAEVARQMALGARAAFGAGVGVATTGVAGRTRRTASCRGRCTWPSWDRGRAAWSSRSPWVGTGRRSGPRPWRTRSTLCAGCSPPTRDLGGHGGRRAATAGRPW